MRQTVLIKLSMVVIACLIGFTSFAQPNWTYTNTGVNHNILISSSPLINGSNLSSGDYIGVFFTDGANQVCGGYIEWSGSSTAVTAWGDDSMSPAKDGFANGETFIWKVWRASDGQVVAMTASYIPGFPNEGTYATNGMSGLVSLTGTAVVLPLAATGVGTNVSCFGGANGSINITPTGGTPPYSYSWSNFATTQDLSGLTAGTYTITVYDATSAGLTLPWTYVNTGLNHTVYIQTAPIVNGTAISSGDYVGVFYIDGTSTVCGGYIMWEGIPTAISAWGDDSTTPAKDGFNNGENFIWKVWKASDGGQAAMIPTYLPGFPNTGTFSANGMSGLVSLVGTYTPPTIVSATVTTTITQPTDVVVAGTVTNILCNGGNTGAVVLNVSGGTSPYTYLWSNNATTANLSGVVAGTYTVTVSDSHSCTDVTSYTITQPATGINLSAVLSAYGSYQIGAYGASNGSINLSVAGGTSPFVYHWSNGPTTQDISNIPAGTYTVTVSDANLCTSTASYILAQPTQLVVQHSIDDVTCQGGNDGAIELTVTGGIAPYTYHWSNNATTNEIINLAAGFYGVTVTDAGSGTYSNLFVIEDGYELVFSLPADASICQGNSFQIQAGTYASYLWSNSATTSSITVSTAGTYSVVVSDANGCQAVDEFVLTVLSLPVVNLGPDATVCAGNSYTLNAGSFSSYLWSNAATTASINVNAPGTYAVTVTNSNGCQGSDNFVLSNYSLPVVNLGPDAQICEGDSYQLNAGSFNAYNWSSGQATPSITVELNGTYTVTVTDAHGCTGTDSFNLTYFITNPVNLGANQAICTGTSTNLNGGDYAIYLWSTGATTSTLTVSAAGTYGITVTDVNGCQSSDNVGVSLLPLPVVSLGPDAAICLGESYTLNAGSFSSYLWSNGATTASINVSEAGTYALTVTDGNGCQNSDSFVLTTNSLPVVDLGTSAVICEGNTYTLDAGNFASYLWSTGGTSRAISIQTAGNYSVTVTDVNGCQGSDSFVLSYYPQILVDLGPDAAICQGASYTISAGNYNAYTWSTNETTSSINVDAAGTYSITTTDANGCHSSDSFVLTVNALPVVDLGADAAICYGDAYMLNAGNFVAYDWSNDANTSSISVSTAGTYSVTVTDGNGCENSDSFVLTVNSLPVVNLGTGASICEGNSQILNAGAFTSYLWSSNQTSQVISVSDAGTYTVTVTDGNGCQGSASFVLSYYPQTLVDLGADAAICADGSYTLSAGSYAGYLWSTAETTSSIVVNLAGTYSVTTTDINGCHSNDSFVLTVHALPTPSLGADAAICFGDSYQLNAGNYTTYDWSTSATTAGISVSTSGTYSVTVTDANGCVNSDSFELTVNALPVVDLGGAATICEENTYTLDAGVFAAYVWSTGATTQTLVLENAGTYTVTVTDGNGCQGSASFVLSYYPQTLVDLGADAAICADGSYTLSAGSYAGYLWSTAETTSSIVVNLAGTYSVTTTDINGCHSNDSFVLTVHALPTPSLGADAAICFGDSYQLNAGNYTAYDWSTSATTAGISVSTAGTYSVTVTDVHGCENSDSFELTVNALPVVDLGPDQNFCIGQPALISAGNFTSYLWSTGETTSSILVNANGNFAVTVTDSNGCQGTDDLNLVPATPFELGANAAICNGQSYTFDASNSFDSYLWSNGATTSSITVQTAGTYSVTVTSGLCSVSDFATLTVYSLPVVNLGSDQTICANQSVTLNAGNYTAYSWSTGATSSSLLVNSTGNYSVTVTDLHGCVNSDEFVLTVNPLPIVTLPVDATICADASVTLDAGTFAAYSWSTGATTQTIVANTTGMFTVTVTDNNGCQNSDMYHLTVNALPVVNLGADAAICFGNSVTLDAGTFAAYSWSTGATTQTIVANTTGMYEVTVTDNNGCQNSDMYHLTVNALPVVNLGADAAICFGNSVTLDAGTFAGYSWSTGATTQTIVANTTGMYEVTVTDNNGCQNSDMYHLTVNALPVVNLGADAAICFGNSVTLDAGTFAGYSWSTGATTQTIVANTTGMFTVTVTDNNGCQNSDMYHLTVNALPVVNLGTDAAICFGNSVTLDAGTFAGYSWSTGATTQTIVANTTGMYEVTVTDNNGCQNSDMYHLTVNALPVVNLGTDAAICFGNSVTLDAGTFAGYSWSTGATTQTIVANTTGMYEVTVTDNNGCQNSDMYHLTVNALPIVNLGLDAAICFGNSVTLDAGTFAGYSWSTGATTQTISASVSGAYTVTVTDGNNCQNTDSYNLTVNALPVVHLGNDASICFGNSVTLDAGTFAGYIWSTGATTQTIVANTTGSYSVTVTDGNSCQNSDSYNLTVNPLPLVDLGADAFICAGNSITFDAGSFASFIWSNGETGQTITVDASNTYAVTVTDNNGCENSDAIILTVNPLPIVDLGPDTTICSGSTYTLNAGSYIVYEWSTGATTATLDVAEAGTYAVTVTDGNGCSNSDQVTIQLSVVIVLPPQYVICDGDFAVIDATGFATYEWSNGSSSASIEIGDAGTYSVTVTDNNGCQSSASIELIVNPLPVVDFGGDTLTFVQGSSLVLNPGTFMSYEWSTGATSPTIEVNQENTYSVTVSNEFGCIGSDSVFVDETIGINDVNFAASINVYPNPTQGDLYIQSNGYRIEKVVIYNGIGEVISVQSDFDTVAHVRVTNLSEGVYFLNIISVDKQSVVKSFKLVK